MKRTRRSPPPAAQMRVGAPMLVDAGVLVALFDRLDRHHRPVTAWMARADMQLLTVPSVLVETSFFLPARLRVTLAGLAAHAVLEVRGPDAAGYARVGELFEKYADCDPDWADLELVWLAESSGIHRIATLDTADFSVYRIGGRKRFELALLG